LDRRPQAVEVADVAAVDEDGHVLPHVAVFVQDLPVQLGAQRYQPPQQLADKGARRQVYLEVALTGRLPQSCVEPHRRHR